MEKIVIGIHLLSFFASKRKHLVDLKCIIINTIIAFSQLYIFNRGYILAYTNRHVPPRRLHQMYPGSKLDPTPTYFHNFVRNNNCDIQRNIHYQIQHHSKILTLQDDHYTPISIISDLILPTYICYSYSNNFLGSVICSIFRIMLNWHIKNLM